MPNITMEEREEAGTCDEHGPFTGTFRRMGGRDFPARCPECEAIKLKAREESQRQHEDREKKSRMEHRIARSGIPKRFLERSFDNYRAEPGSQQERALGVCKRFAEMFEDKMEQGGGLLLCGNPGSGKTHLATAIASHVIRELGYIARYTTVYNVIRHVRTTWNKDSDQTEAEAIGDIVSPHLLILDEVGVQYGSESEKIILFEVLNRRYEEMRPTILISNLNREGVADSIGERNVDRMREGGGAVIGFTWGSYRSEVHKDPDLNGKHS